MDIFRGGSDDLREGMEDVKIRDRLLINPEFIPNIDLSLQDIVFVYNDGRNWKIIPLSIAQKFPIIHDKYFEAGDSKMLVKITVYMCPYSFFSCVYFGEFKSYDKVYNSNLVIEDGNKVIFPIMNLIKSDDGEKFIRKAEVKSMLFRTAVTRFPDLLGIDPKGLPKFQALVDDDYLDNDKIMFKTREFSPKYHPKTIVYIIEYISKRTHKYKYTVVVLDKDDDRTKVEKYLNDVLGKIRERGGIIYPCFWFAWNSLFPKSKLIIL